MPLPSWSQETAASEENAGWTVPRLREKVEAAIKRFDTVILEAVYTQTRDVNAFRSEEPLLLKGSGSIEYHGDQERWFLREEGFTYRAGVAKAIPQTRITGFDGEIHYHGNLRRLTLAESGSRRSARPQGMIWEPILTYQYLRDALERDTTKVVFAGESEGEEVVDIETTWGNAESPWKLVVRFDTGRSFLPLWQKLDYMGKPYAESSIAEITAIEGTDDWYPATITTKFHQQALTIVDKKYSIEKLELRDSFGPDDMRFEAPPGADVIDRRSNMAWHNDPWWDEMMPWTVRTLNYPRRAFQALNNFASHCDPELEGQVAPPIAASDWLGEDPGPWDRDGRRFSVLYFWGEGSSLSSPFPEWTTEMGHLANLVEPFGGEVIGIASDQTDLDKMRETARELMIEIPFAIDQDSEGQGVTHDAYLLKHYYSVVIVDDEGKVRLLGEGDGSILSVISEILDEDEMDAVRSLSTIDASMSRAEHDAIKARWIALRRRVQGRGSIIGTVKPAKGATVKLLPQMKMLAGSNPGGYMLFQDHRGEVSIDVDPVTGTYELSDLPRGLYQLSVVAENGKAEKTNVVLGENDETHSRDFSLE